MSAARALFGRLYNSLQARLILLVLVVSLLVSVLGISMSYTHAIDETRKVFDTHLAQTAHLLLALAIRVDDQVFSEQARDINHRDGARLHIQVWEKKNDRFELRVSSSRAGAEPLVPFDNTGFSDTVRDSHRLRVFSAPSEDGRTLAMVGQNDRARVGMARHLAFSTLDPFLYTLPLLALLLFFSIRHGLAPLRSLRRELTSRAPQKLDPIELPKTVSELQTVLDALNRLLDQVSTTLENERRFTDDAAHELRTPIAGLLTHLQVAMMLEDPIKRKEALEKCLLGARRMAYTVDQLLTLARIEASRVDAPPLEPVDIVALARSVCSDQSAGALKKSIALQLETGNDEAVFVQGNQALLEIMLRNLVNNAIRYTPQNGTVSLEVARQKGSVVLRVFDNGPGVPPEKISLLGQRFQRLDAETGDGVGLGLSIVGRIIERHDAALIFSNEEPHGLRATVTFK